MCIFKKNSETTYANSISLITNQIKFFDMSKITKSSPILKRNGVEFNYVTHIQSIAILT